MKTIEVDDDIYAHLLKNTRELGETASHILRRLLGLDTSISPNVKTSLTNEHELSKVLSDRSFTRLNSVVHRFLFILGAAYQAHKADFDKVLSIKGRERDYFAKSREAIEKSGNSTQPKQIPGSPYWVMTNSPTAQKQEMLEEVLTLLGYSDTSIKEARATLIK